MDDRSGSSPFFSAESEGDGSLSVSHTSAQSSSGAEGKKSGERDPPEKSESDTFIYGTEVSRTTAKIYGASSASLPTSLNFSWAESIGLSRHTVTFFSALFDF